MTSTKPSGVYMSTANELPPISGWPRVRRIGSGYRIECRCLTVGTWAVLQRVSASLIVAGGCLLLAAAMSAWWGPRVFDAVEGTKWYDLAKVPVSIRFGFRDLLVEDFPNVGEFLRYRSRALIDWHLGGISILMLAAVHPLAGMLTKLGSLLLHPIVKRKIRITVTSRHVRVRGWLFTKSFLRDDNGVSAIRFRKVSPQAYNSRFSALSVQGRPLHRPLIARPPAVIELVFGMRRRKLVFARYGEQAEAFIAACNEAMVRTHRPLPL